MPGPPRQFDEAEVLRIATEVFRERGYAHTSLGEIQQRAGLSRQSLYNAFESKDALFASVLELYEREQLAHLADVLRGPGSGRARLLRIFELLAKDARDIDCPGCLFGNAAGELNALAPEIRERLRHGFLTVENAARAAAQDAIDEGDLAGDLAARDVARLVVALIEGVSLFNRLQDGPTFAQSVLRALRGLLAT